MTGMTAKRLAASPLHRLLDQELQRLSKLLPAKFWERALVGPAREFLARPGKELRAHLVQSGWGLVGGSPTGAPLELLLAVELIHAGSLIVDDVEDGALTRRGGCSLHRMVGTPLAINTGGWLYFLPASLVERAGLDPDTTAALHRHTQQAMLACHEGQALDLAWRVTELEQAEVPAVVAATTSRKTAALTSVAAVLGAVAAGGAPASVQGVSAFGHELGIALQMLDDLGPLVSPSRAHKAAEDLRAARPTWPWAWAAQDLGARAYAELRAAAREVEAGGDHLRLAQMLSDCTTAGGATRARAQLRRAFARLRATFGASPVVRQVERDFEKLDASYGV